MPMDIIDIVLEAIGQLPGLPRNFTEALVEGAHALTGGTREFRPLTAEETDAVVAYLKGNSARIGVPFDEGAIRADIRKRPGKYQATLSNLRARRSMPTALDRKKVQDDRQRRQENRNTRFAYYAALVARLAKSFSYYNIPFDTNKAMQEIEADDSRWLSTLCLHDATSNPTFRSLGEAMKDPAASLLRRRNPALAKFIGDAFNFGKLNERELERKKTEYSYMRKELMPADAATNVLKPDEESTVTREVDNMIAPWFSENASLGTVLEKCKGVPYEQVYRYFKEHGGGNRIANAPMPGEDLVTYLARLPRGDESILEFTAELNRVAESAYGRTAMMDAVGRVKNGNPDMFADIESKCSRTLVKPKDLPLYTAWETLHAR